MTYISINPYTKKVTQQREFDGYSQVERALETSQSAFKNWSSLSFDERAKPMQALGELLETHHQELAKLVSEEMGKLKKEAEAEIKKSAELCFFYAQNAQTMLADELNPATSHARIIFQPLGCIFAVMPWNFPIWQVIRFAAPNLMAGNVGILKHAENMPQTAEYLQNLFVQAGFGEGVFQTLFIDANSSAKLIADTRCKGVTLTGSGKAGSSVAATAGKHLKPTVLELGGSDAFIVCEDANLERAIKIAARARFSNAGQVCIAAKRFIVHESIGQTFKQGLVDYAQSLEFGAYDDEQTTIAPMARTDLLTNLDAQVQASIKAGAKCLCGGYGLSDYQYLPTVLDEPPIDCPAWQEELFGPVAVVKTFNTDEQALKLANMSEYGLGASVWSNNKQRLDYFAQHLEVGMVAINSAVKSEAAVAFGGIKNSGYGRELGELGIKAFVNAKVIAN